jgi:hypothetical protein
MNLSAPDLGAIPASMKALDRWTAWRTETVDDRPTKVPKQVQEPFYNASSSNPGTWTSFDIVRTALQVPGVPLSGPAFMLGPLEDGRLIIGIDADACRNPDSGEIVPKIRRLLDRCRTYAEISPSKTGVKLYGYATALPEALLHRKSGKKHKSMEVSGDWVAPDGCDVAAHGPELALYTSGRYFAATGWRLPDCPEEPADLTGILPEIVAEMLAMEAATRAGPKKCAPLPRPASASDPFQSPWPLTETVDALAQIANSLGRLEWLKLAAALKTSYGSSAWPAFRDFSLRYTEGSCTEAAARHVWDTSTDGAATFGSVIYLLQQGGWERPRNGHAHSAPHDPITGEIIEVRAGSNADGWRPPETLSDPADDPTVYPEHHLPPIVGDAIRECAAYGQQPVVLIAASALATMSLAVQGLVDVRRDAVLIGPVSLNCLVVAESGERKTAADLIMRRGIDAWEKAERKRLSSEIAERQAAVKAHEAQFAGTLSKLRSKQQDKPGAGRDADVEALKTELKALARSRPILPPVPTPRIEDATPEGIARDLRERWPSAALWSNEGGIVVGGHGFSDERAMMTLSQLNKLWDGQPLDRSRSTEERSLVYGRRLTANLLLQPVAFSKLIGGQEGIARGLGTLARFLPAWPASTMGSRLYRPPVESTLTSAFPALERFCSRVEQLLRLPLPMPYDLDTGEVAEDLDGPPADALELKPAELPLSVAARAVWVEYLNDIEKELRADGEYSTVRDVAAKSAENACRLAAIFHTFVNGPGGDVGVSDMERGAHLAAWYLHEARRMLSGTPAGDGDGEIGDGRLLFEWVQSRPAPPTLKELAQQAPYRLRSKERRNRALSFLTAKHWIRVDRQEGISVVAINPLLGGGARP